MNIFLNIDDDVSKVIRKVKKVSATDLVLVLPKQSLLFSDPINLKLLKKQTDLLGKTVSILTMDINGQKMAVNNGFALSSMDALRRGGPSMDVGRGWLKPKPALHKTKEPKRSPKKTSPKTTVIENPEEDYDQPTEYITEYPEKPLAPLETPSLYEDLRSMRRNEEQQTPQENIGYDASEQEMENLPVEEESSAGISQSFSEPLIAPEAEDFEDRFSTDMEPAKAKNYGRVIKAGVVLALIILILLVVVILPQANITVYARSQPIVRDMQISVDQGGKSVNPQQLIIPGQLVDKDVQENKQYNSTGQLNVGNPARGTVQIYNFTHKILKLGAATTTLTVGQNVYRFENDVDSIKPTRYVPGTNNVDPASLVAPVPVVAAQPGDGYNLPGGTRFEIHNQILGTNPQLLYAKNNEAIEGGVSRYRSIVSQADLNNAAKDISADLFNQVKQDFQDTKNMTILSSGSVVHVSGVKFDKNVNDESLTFNATVTGHITALAFNNDDLRSLVEQRINLTLDPDKYLVTGQSEKITEDYKNVDLAAGTGVLTLHFESVLGTKIDTKGIAAQATGKNAVELKEMLLSNPDIDGVNISFKPFWVTSVPRFSGRVYVTSKLNQ